MFPATWARIPPPPPGAFVSCGSKIGHLLGAEQLAEPRAAAAAEQARRLRRATRRELVDDHEPGSVLSVLTFVG